MKALYTSVQSGRFKGKKLLLPSKEGTRSTKARVKACVFNTIRDYLTDCVFIEAFAGSASMAIEASSNYALKALGVEKDRAAFKVATQNSNSVSSVEIHHGDSFALLPSLISTNSPCILYLDPPFDTRSGFEGVYERLFSLLETCDLENVRLIVLEYKSSFEIPKEIASFTLFKQKSFGNTSLAFYELPL